MNQQKKALYQPRLVFSPICNGVSIVGEKLQRWLGLMASFSLRALVAPTRIRSSRSIGPSLIFRNPAVLPL